MCSGCKIDIVLSKTGGSRFKSSGTAIDCRSRMPSGVSIGEPARTRSHHGCFRKCSAKTRGEIFQLIDVARLTLQCKRQLARLLEIAVVDFQSIHRAEFARKHIHHIAIEQKSGK